MTQIPLQVLYITIITVSDFKWRYDHRSGNCNLSTKQLPINPKNIFRDLTWIQTHGLCISTRVLYKLSYEDPYINWEQANLLSSS